MTTPDLKYPENAANARWRELAREAQQGNAKSYAILLREIVPYIKSILTGSLANYDWVDDITQDVLISVHKSLGTYSPELPFRPWLRAIIQFRKTDFLRKHYKAKATMDNATQNVEIFGESVTNTAHAGELKDIEAALDTLPDKQRAIIERVKIQGHSIKDVAEEMGMTDSAVKVSVHRAITKLKDKLG